MFNVVNGDKEAGDALLHNPDVKAASFVGSTPVAKYIHQIGTANGKRIQALGGAKNHAIIMPDADLEMTANALMVAAYGSAGERCIAISVAVPVTDAVTDALIDIMVPKIKATRIGPTMDKSSEMGPLVTEQHLAKVPGYIDTGEAEAANVVVDGRTFSQDVEAGMIGINVPIPVPMAYHSFGGWKSSIFGEHHMHGMEGIRFYTRIKTTTTRWPSGQSTDPEFTMPTLG